MILFAIIKLIFEFIQFVKYRIQYFIDWVNYLEILLFVFAIFFSFVYTEDCYCPHRWQWELGAIAVFLSWIDLVIFIRKLPITGIYVVMFINIFYIFLKLVFLAILLVLAFAFSFNMLFNDPIVENMGIVSVCVYVISFPLLLPLFLLKSSLFFSFSFSLISLLFSTFIIFSFSLLSSSPSPSLLLFPPLPPPLPSVLHS